MDLIPYLLTILTSNLVTKIFQSTGNCYERNHPHHRMSEANRRCTQIEVQSECQSRVVEKVYRLLRVQEVELMISLKDQSVPMSNCFDLRILSRHLRRKALAEVHLGSRLPQEELLSPYRVVKASKEHFENERDDKKKIIIHFIIYLLFKRQESDVETETSYRSLKGQGLSCPVPMEYWINISFN